jgi:hypothetical protein
LLQGSGSKSIVVTATGYSGDAVLQTIAGVPSPTLRGVSSINGNFTFNFTSVPGLSFSVLATNVLTAPIVAWPIAGLAVESPAGSGNYQFTNSAATTAQQYYILRQP